MSEIDVSRPIPFGKHRGTPWRELPVTYLLWMVESMANPKWTPWAVQALSGRITPSRLALVSPVEAPSPRSAATSKPKKHGKRSRRESAEVQTHQHYSAPIAVDASLQAPWE